MRRYFWNNLAVRGDPLEYTGLAIELLLGFLIVLAIFVPVQLAYALALTLLTPYALYRARRYRLSRTRWRGIRFGQDASTASGARAVTTNSMPE